MSMMSSGLLRVLKYHVKLGLAFVREICWHYSEHVGQRISRNVRRICFGGILILISELLLCKIKEEIFKVFDKTEEGEEYKIRLLDHLKRVKNTTTNNR